MNRIERESFGSQLKHLICWKSKKMSSPLLDKNLNFKILRLDPNPEHWEGKRGAIAGALLAIVKERTIGASPEGITSICSLLRDSTNSQAESMLRSIRRYASLSK